MTRWLFVVPGALLLLLGLLWALQGAGVVSGSPMSGKRSWVEIGSVVALVGLVVLYLGIGRRRHRI